METNVIKFYSPRDDFGCFSNFYRCKFEYDGMEWKNSEAAYQAQKFLDRDIREKVRLLATPREAADMGRDKTLPLRPSWDLLKYEVMHSVVLAKFRQNPSLQAKLLSTGDKHIVENSPTDYIWGIGADGTGTNWLGRILMEVRLELKGEACEI